MKNLTGIRKNGEDIVIRDRRSLRRARKIASRLSSTRNHAWASIWYRDSRTRQIVQEVWYEGHKFHSITRTDHGEVWFSRFLTLEQAISCLQ